MPDLPWTIGTATGVGSHPGDDPAEALRIVLDQLPDLPYLPELPARGPGADMIGRAAGLLVELAVALQPSGWRFADRPGRDTIRAHSMLARDLDTLEEQAGDYEGPFKIQITGPWTLAASIELRHGDRALRDPGAVRDLIASLAEGVAAHVADVRRRLPRATILLQLDEPGLPGVLAGTVPTASGFSRLPAVEAPLAEDGLRRVIEATDAFPIVHSCAPRTPYGLLRGAGAKAISVDAASLRGADEDAIGEAVEAGAGFLLGIVPGTDTRLPTPKQSLGRVQELWRRLGFSPRVLAEGVVVTPACGLAGASPGYVRAALKHCGEAARVLAETAED
ncbi:methionine synthase [Actinoallomurus sp. NPDC052308]|uniref:methionine synthase n=1 Tax=Actinoallomurus sp. NPDC052308 TaxID=3155530 RepID=UPI00341A0636